MPSNGSAGRRREDEADVPDWPANEELITVSDGRLRSVDITTDELFAVLSNRRRRAVLEHLEGAPGGVSVRDLCERIAAAENDTTPENVAYDDRKRVYTSLHQNHLPKMKDLGMVEHDRETDEVRLADSLDGLRVRVEFDGRSPAGASGGSWVFVYGVLAVAALVGTLGVGLGIPPLGAVPPVAVLGATTALLLAAAAAHAVSAAR